MFKHADAQDRAGQITLFVMHAFVSIEIITGLRKTANAFYVCSALFDVLRSFSSDGQLDDEVQNRISLLTFIDRLEVEAQRKYSVFKAKYIRECLREGRTPVAGLVVPLLIVDDSEDHRTN